VRDCCADRTHRAFSFPEVCFPEAKLFDALSAIRLLSYAFLVALEAIPAESQFRASGFFESRTVVTSLRVYGRLAAPQFP